MIWIDAVCLALYVAILGMQKTRDNLLIALSFSASVAYTSSSYFDIHPASVNHLIISLCFLLSLPFLCKTVTIYAFIYLFYHWVISGDYLFFESHTILSDTFHIVSPALNALVMAALIYAGHNGNSIRINSLDRGWLSDIFLRFIHRKKMAKH